MLNLTIQEKERIGKLLRYYRKKNKIQWKEIEKVLSKSTYSKIEKGYVTNNIDIYYKIFDLFNITYAKKDNFKEWFHNYLIRLNHILEYYKEEEFDSLINDLNNELELYKNYVIYEQYYQVITYILNYYKYSRYMILEEIEDCLLLFECFDLEKTIMIYLLEVMYISNSNKIFSYEIQEKIIKYINQYKSPILMYCLGFYYKTLSSFEIALTYFRESLNYWKSKSNDYRKSKLLMGMFVIYKNIDKIKAKETIKIINKYKNENKIHHSIIQNLNYNIAMFYYVERDYNDALSYFWENINQYNRFNDLLFVCSIYSKIDKPLPHLLLENNFDNHPYKEYFNYFRMKYLKESNHELVNYIFKFIIPNKLVYCKYEQPYWKMFEDELIQISLMDKRYSVKLIEYIEKKNKTCKKG